MEEESDFPDFKDPEPWTNHDRRRTWVPILGFFALLASAVFGMVYWFFAMMELPG